MGVKTTNEDKYTVMYLFMSLYAGLCISSIMMFSVNYHYQSTSNKLIKHFQLALESDMENSGVSPAPEVGVISQHGLVSRQQRLHGSAGLSPGLVTQTHKRVQGRLEGRCTLVSRGSRAN